ncbi:MAG: DUF7005 family protein [Verrucomicrobiales bacterium]
MSENLTRRRSILESFGFSRAAIEILLTVLQRDVPAVRPAVERSLLGAEIFIPEWIEVVVKAGKEGALEALREIIFELNFPIAEGTSATPAYQELALAGGRNLADVRDRLPPEGPQWEKPAAMRLSLHDSGGGLIPVLQTGSRADFETLVRAIIHHNEPKPVPASMGSVFINGYPNRRRYLLVRKALAEGVLPAEKRDPQLWRDKFIIISTGPYSGVDAESLGLTVEKWRDLSVAIRIDHECTHYLARRLFPRLKFGLQDELVADFAGLMSATGLFPAQMFLTFMGLENFPDYRTGGRFENYQKELGVSSDAFHAVGRLLVEASRHLERSFADWSAARWDSDRGTVIAALTHASLEELAAGQALPGSASIPVSS